MKKLLLTLLIPSMTFAESAKLEEAFNLVNQLTITSAQAEMVAQIKADLREAHKLSEKAQKDLLECLDREGEAIEETKKEEAK